MIFLRLLCLSCCGILRVSSALLNIALLRFDFLFAVLTLTELLHNLVEVVVTRDVRSTRFFEANWLTRCLLYSWSFTHCTFSHEVLKAESEYQEPVRLPINRFHGNCECRPTAFLILTRVDLVAHLFFLLQIFEVSQDLIELVTLSAHLTARHHVVGDVEHDDLARVLHVVGFEPQQFVFVHAEWYQV